MMQTVIIPFILKHLYIQISLHSNTVHSVQLI